MSPFWASLFNELGGRGRNAKLFIHAIALLVGLLLFTSQIPREVYVNYVLPVLPWAGLLVAAGLARSILKARARRRERWQRGPLSRDELSKARSKLVKDRNPKLS